MNFQYPAWFPYPRCWLRALIATMLSIAIAQILAGLLVAMFFHSLLTSSLETLGPTMLVFVVLSFAISLPMLAGIRQLVDAACQTFQGKPDPSKGKLPSKLHWNEALVDWLAFLIGGFIFTSILIFLPRMFSDDPSRDITREEATLLTICILVFVAYFHQVRYLMVQRLEEKRKQKDRDRHRQTLPRTKRPSRPATSDRDRNSVRRQPPDPIADEVTKMRTELAEQRTLDEELERLKNNRGRSDS